MYWSACAVAMGLLLGEGPPCPAELGAPLCPLSSRELRTLAPTDPGSPWAGVKLYATDSWDTTRFSLKGPGTLTVVTTLDVPSGGAPETSHYEIIVSEVVPQTEANAMRLFADGGFVPAEESLREVAREPADSGPWQGLRFTTASAAGDMMAPTEPRRFSLDVPEGVHVYAFRLGTMDPEVTVWGQAFWANVGLFSASVQTADSPPDAAVQPYAEISPPEPCVAPSITFPEAPLRVGGLYRAELTLRMPDGRVEHEVRWVEPRQPGALRLDLELWPDGRYAGTHTVAEPVLPQVAPERLFVIGMYEQTDGSVMHKVNGEGYRLNSCFAARAHHRPPGSDPVGARRAYGPVFEGIRQISANTVIPFLEVVPEHYPQYFEMARRHGLRVIMSVEDLMHFLIGSRTRGARPTNERIYQEARTNVERLRHYPNLLRYAVGDEPDVEGIAVLDRIVKILASLDPDHAAYIPFIAHGSEEGPLEAFVRRLAPYHPSEVVVDWYPAMREQGLGGFVEDHIRRMRGAAQNHAALGVDWWYVAQGFGNHLIWRWPTVEEYRFSIEAALACGAKGILHCLYGTSGPEDNQFEYDIEGLADSLGNPRAQWFEAQRLNRRMVAMADTLLGLQWRGDAYAHCPDGSLLVVSHEAADGGPHVYCVNKNVQEPVEAAVQITLGGVREARPVPQGKAIPVIEGRAVVRLEPGDGTLLLLAR